MAVETSPADGSSSAGGNSIVRGSAGAAEAAAAGASEVDRRSFLLPLVGESSASPFCATQAAAAAAAAVSWAAAGLPELIERFRLFPPVPAAGEAAAALLSEVRSLEWTNVLGVPGAESGVAEAECGFRPSDLTGASDLLRAGVAVPSFEAAARATEEAIT